MLVRLQFGSRVGEVVDFLPHEARAMLADGRATEPDAQAGAPDDAAISALVDARQDRVLPAARTRRRR